MNYEALECNHEVVKPCKQVNIKENERIPLKQ